MRFGEQPECGDTLRLEVVRDHLENRGTGNLRCFSQGTLNEVVVIQQLDGTTIEFEQAVFSNQGQ